MSRMPAASTLAVVSALIAAPVLAQQPVPPAAPATTVPSAGPASPGMTAGRLQKTDGGWRSSRIVGATVYNDSDQSIGTVDDLIVGQDGKISTAVISVGGFLGMGSKLVRVPYDQLRFEERTPSEASALTAPPLDGAPTTAAGSVARDVPAGAGRTATVTPNATTTRIVLPGASKDSLTAMPKFDYGT
jgi:PRC-barrel domain